MPTYMYNYTAECRYPGQEKTSHYKAKSISEIAKQLDIGFNLAKSILDKTTTSIASKWITIERDVETRKHKRYIPVSERSQRHNEKGEIL